MESLVTTSYDVRKSFAFKGVTNKKQYSSNNQMKNIKTFRHL
jgi:hypothetical protein